MPEKKSDKSSRNIRANIRRIMKVRGLTHKGMADLVGCSSPNITQLLNGKSRSITLKLADSLAKRLGISVSSLIGDPKEFSKIPID